VFFRRNARQSFADGSQLLGVPNLRRTLPELAHLEILPVALNLASMAMDILPEAKCRNVRSIGKHMLLSDWRAILLELVLVTGQPAFYHMRISI